jgi:hypothetical protein
MNNEIKQQVVDARLNKKWTYSMIFEEFGIPKSTAQGWISKYESVDSEDFKCDNHVANYHTNFQRERPARFDRKDQNLVMEFLEQLAPIKVNTTFDNITHVSPNEYAVVGSDFHFGTHDEKCIDIFLQVVEDIRPKIIILNGDTMDMLAISKYPKDIAKKWSLLDERLAYYKFLDNLLRVSGGAKIYETVSNHSGQSIDGRWRRYLSERLGELATLPDIVDKLSYQNVFMGEYQQYVEHVDYVDLNGLIVTHGTTVRKNGGASARGEIDKWNASILHGHTHRIGSTAQRIPAIGNRPEKQIFGFEGGCMCSLDAAYGSGAMNWQQGFNIIGLGGDTFSMEQVMIQNGSANVATIGCNYKA